MRILIALLIISTSVLLNACSTSTGPSDSYQGQTQAFIYQKGVEALRDKSYSEAIKRFEALDVQYPFGTETESAQLYLIYAYYMKEEYTLAVAAADRFIRMHPTNPHVDYAYYMRGISNYYQNLGVIEQLFTIDLATRDLTQIQKSYHDFSELTTSFPHSMYTPSAHQYMVYLRNVLANHELEVGQYYYNRGAYVAAVNRASSVVTNYQGAPAVVDALVLMIKADHQLGLSRQEQEALTVLHFNYPNMKVTY
ncbi:MAG TPA: outer membrane protein assembly factor BamD [Gammaproteobacteria bacterium]|nr:outer membrane protein assembly factor BamD [Gammaproteobacteria bacterium]